MSLRAGHRTLGDGRLVQVSPMTRQRSLGSDQESGHHEPFSCAHRGDMGLNSMVVLTEVPSRSHYSNIFSLPASTLFPMSEGPEDSSQSRVLICHIYCRFPAPAHDPPLSTRLFWKRPVCQQIEDSSNTLGFPSQGQGQGPRGSRCYDACFLRKAKASRGRGGGRPWCPLYLSLVTSWE